MTIATVLLDAMQATPAERLAVARASAAQLRFEAWAMSKRGQRQRTSPRLHQRPETAPR